MNSVTNGPSSVQVEIRGRAMWITLQRPEARNALTLPVLADLTSAFSSAATDAGLRAIVIRGSGGHFCAGADLRKNLQDDPEFFDHADIYMDAFQNVIRTIVRCEKPTIAMIEGAAVGFGADLAFACDLRTAAADAYMQERFVKIGLMPDGGGTFWLPRLLGTSRAIRMIFLAEKLDGPKLDELGLLARLAPAEELEKVTSALVDELAQGAPLAFREAKRAIYANWGSLEDALRQEREGQLKLLRSSDCFEGVLAFMQKRAPNFQGA